MSESEYISERECWHSKEATNTVRIIAESNCVQRTRPISANKKVPQRDYYLAQSIVSQLNHKFMALFVGFNSI